MSVKISVAELEYLAIEGEVTTTAGVKLHVVEEGEWIGGGKYEDKTVVFTDGERHYRGTVSRSGSYFTDWTWNSEWDDGDADIDEVAAVLVTVMQWEPILERGHAIYEVGAEEEGWYCVNDAELADLLVALRDGDTESPDSDFVTIIGPAIQTKSGWHVVGPVEQTKEAA